MKFGEWEQNIAINSLFVKFQWTALLHSCNLVLQYNNIMVVQQILKRQVGQRRQRRRRNDLVVALLVPEPERPTGGLDLKSGGGGIGNRIFLLWYQVSRIQPQYING